MIEQLVSRNRYSARPGIIYIRFWRRTPKKEPLQLNRFEVPFVPPRSAPLLADLSSVFRLNFPLTLELFWRVCISTSKHTHTKMLWNMAINFSREEKKHLESGRSGGGGRENGRTVTASRNSRSSESFDLDRIPFHMGFITKLSVSSIKIETTATFRGTDRSRIGIYFSLKRCARERATENARILSRLSARMSWNFLRPQTKAFPLYSLHRHRRRRCRRLSKWEWEKQDFSIAHEIRFNFGLNYKW